MEERQVIRSYKFGLEYCAPGQTTEAQCLHNTHGLNVDNNIESTSAEYKNFLAFLGETINLAGWKGYRAGLDVSGGLFFI
jgi:RAP1 GTPase activating protein 1